MIVNVFFAFGGYFGQFDKSTFSLQKMIGEFAEQLDSGNSTREIQNIVMWHNVLTHGITPDEFLREFSEFVENEF